MEKMPGRPDNSQELAIERIFKGTPDAIVVLSGGIVKKEVAGEAVYKTPSYSELDDKGLASGGKARVIAAAEAHKFFPDVQFVTNSYTKNKPESEPTHAAVIAKELTDLGVPKNSIILEEKSTNTLTELIELVKLSEEKHWHNVAIISNEYHLPRIQEMINRLESLTAEDAGFQEILRSFHEHVLIQLVAAEDLLRLRSPHYDHLIEKVEETEAYKKRLEAEQEGIDDLRDGRYGK